MMSSSQICEFHMRGRCRFGNKCRKSHHLDFSWNEEAPISGPFLAQINPRRYRNRATIDQISAEIQAHKRKMELEEAKRLEQRLKLPNHMTLQVKKREMEEIAAAENKSGNGNENASCSNLLGQKKMKENNDGVPWDGIIRSAMDSDLLCNICFEIFIKPTVINCSHTFCETCIHVWTLRVKNCPICRLEVTSKSYCLNLESFIGKIVEHLPVEIKNKREAAIKEREIIKTERPPQVNHSLSSGSFSGFMLLVPPSMSHTQPRQNQVAQNIGFNTDAITNEQEMLRMNLNDAVVANIRDENRLMNYMDEAQTFNRNITEPRYPSARH